MTRVRSWPAGLAASVVALLALLASVAQLLRPPTGPGDGTGPVVSDVEAWLGARAVAFVRAGAGALPDGWGLGDLAALPISLALLWRPAGADAAGAVTAGRIAAALATAVAAVLLWAALRRLRLPLLTATAAAGLFLAVPFLVEVHRAAVPITFAMPWLLGAALLAAAAADPAPTLGPVATSTRRSTLTLVAIVVLVAVAVLTAPSALVAVLALTAALLAVGDVGSDWPPARRWILAGLAAAALVVVAALAADLYATRYVGSDQRVEGVPLDLVLAAAGGPVGVAFIMIGVIGLLALGLLIRWLRAFVLASFALLVVAAAVPDLAGDALALLAAPLALVAVGVAEAAGSRLAGRFRSVVPARWVSAIAVPVVALALVLPALPALAALPGTLSRSGGGTAGSATGPTGATDPDGSTGGDAPAAPDGTDGSGSDDGADGSTDPDGTAGTTPDGADGPAGTWAAADQALAWIRTEADPAARLVVDDALWPALVTDGGQLGRMTSYSGLGSDAPPPSVPADPTAPDGVLLLVGRPPDAVSTPVTEEARTAAESSLPLASFGTGEQRVEIRQVVADPAVAAEARFADAALRRRIGEALAANPNLLLEPADREAMVRGEVDRRLLAALAELGSTRQITVAGFDVAPGEDPAATPRRTVRIASIDGRPVTSGDPVLDRLDRWFSAQLATFRPRDLGVVDYQGSDQIVVRYSAPSPVIP